MFKRLMLPVALLFSINFTSIDSAANGDSAFAIGSFGLGAWTGFAVYKLYRCPTIKVRPVDPILVGTAASIGIFFASAVSGQFLPGIAVIFGLPLGTWVSILKS